MDTPEPSISRASSYKRSFDDLDTGADSSNSGLGLPLLVAAAGEDTSRHDRHKRPRSERNSPSHAAPRDMHIPFDSFHSQTLDTRTSTLSHSAAASPLRGQAGPSTNLSHDILESVESSDVDMSLSFSGELRSEPSPSDSFADPSLYSPPTISSTQASASTSGDATPPDTLSTNEPRSPAQASLAVFAPLEVPLPPTRASTSAEAVANANAEARFRLSMERFNAFEDHISILRYPNSEQEAPSTLPPVVGQSRSNVTPSFHDVDDEVEWLEEPHVSVASATPLTISLSRSPSPVRSVASLSQLRNARENQRHEASDSISYSERHNRVIEERRRLFGFDRIAPADPSAPSPPLRPHATEVLSAHTPEGPDNVMSAGGMRHLIERQSAPSWQDIAGQRQPSRRPPAWVITGSTRTDRQNDDSRISSSSPARGTPSTEDERTRDWITARALEVTRTRSGHTDSRPSRDPASVDECPAWSPPPAVHGSASRRRAQQREEETGVRSVGVSTSPVMPVQPSLLAGRLDSESSRHRRRTSDADEVEVAWLFNEVEDRYQVTGDHLFADAPAGPWSPSLAQRDAYGPAPPATIPAGINRDQSGTSGTGSGRRRVPRIPRMSLLDESDSDEEAWEPLLPSGTIPSVPRLLHDTFLPSQERQHTQFPHWADESLSEGETRDWLLPGRSASYRRPAETLAMGDAADMYPPPFTNVTRGVRFSDTSFSEAETAPRRQVSGNGAGQDFYDEVVWGGRYLSTLARAEQAREDMDETLGRLGALTRDNVSLSTNSQPRSASGRRPSRSRTEEAEVEALLSSNRSVRSAEADYATSESDRSSNSRARRDRSISEWTTRALHSTTTDDSELHWPRLHPRSIGSRATAVPATTTTEFRRFANTARNAVGTSNLLSASDLPRRPDHTNYPNPSPLSPFITRRLPTESHSSYRPESNAASTASQPVQSARGEINLDQYHDGPFRASLARSERLRREREEMSQRNAVRQDSQRHIRSSTSTATSIAADASTTTNGPGSSRYVFASREPPSTITERVERARLGRQRHFQGLRNNREDQRELHDSVTRHLRTPAARLATPGYVWESDGLPSLLPDTTVNAHRQQQLIDNFRSQRSSSNSTARNTSGWGDLDDSGDLLPWRHPRPPRGPPTTAHSTAEDGGHDGHVRTAALRRGWFIGARRRMEREGGLRTFGDYVRDEDLDTSYEGLLRLTNLIGEARPRGTSRSVIDGLPNGVYSEWANSGSEKRCPICLDDYEQSDPVMKVPLCSHWFHRACLGQWLGTANTCPVCRGPVDPNAPASRSRATRGPRGRRFGHIYRGRPAPTPAASTRADGETAGAPVNANVEERHEDDLFDDEERELLLRSLHLLTRRGGP